MKVPFILCLQIQQDLMAKNGVMNNITRISSSSSSSNVE